MSTMSEELSNHGVDSEILQKKGFEAKRIRPNSKQECISGLGVHKHKPNAERLLPNEGEYIPRRVRVIDLVMDDMICNIGYVHSVVHDRRKNKILVTINITASKGKRHFTKEYAPQNVVSVYPRWEYPRHPEGRTIISDDPAFPEELSTYVDNFNATKNPPVEFWEKWTKKMEEDPDIAHLFKK